MEIPKLVLQTREQLRTLTGLPLESTVDVHRESGGGWSVSVEMLEKKSIPDGMDILATYEVSLDDQGGLIGFQRTGLRKRMETPGQFGG